MAWKTYSGGPKASARRYKQSAKGKAAEHKSRLKRLYGMTVEQHAALMAQQHNRCACCGDGLLSKHHIDHDHTTGKVRGILCPHCNVGLGSFHDSQDRLQKAIAYLDACGQIRDLLT